jgi:hypothetical protein
MHTDFSSNGQLRLRRRRRCSHGRVDTWTFRASLTATVLIDMYATQNVDRYDNIVRNRRILRTHARQASRVVSGGSVSASADVYVRIRVGVFECACLNVVLSSRPKLV